MRDLCHQCELLSGRGIWIRKNNNAQLVKILILNCSLRSYPLINISAINFSWPYKYSNSSLFLAVPTSQLLGFLAFWFQCGYSGHYTRKSYGLQHSLLMSPLQDWMFLFARVVHFFHLCCKGINDWHYAENKVIKILLPPFSRVPFKSHIDLQESFEHEHLMMSWKKNVNPFMSTKQTSKKQTQWNKTNGYMGNCNSSTSVRVWAL